MVAVVRAVGSNAKETEMFPSVANEWQNKQKCATILGQAKVCWVSVYGGSEGVFEEPVSYLMGSKLMMLRVVPGGQTVLAQHTSLVATF